MTRLFLSGVGCGFTCAVVVLALVDTRTCIALSFAGAVAFTVGALGFALLGLYVLGQRLGWISSFTSEHSQSGGD